MRQYLWVLTDKGELVCLDEPDGDENYLAGVYPDCIYFFAGAQPITEN